MQVPPNTTVRGSVDNIALTFLLSNCNARWKFSRAFPISFKPNCASPCPARYSPLAGSSELATL